MSQTHRVLKRAGIIMLLSILLWAATFFFSWAMMRPRFSYARFENVKEGWAEEQVLRYLGKPDRDYKHEGMRYLDYDTRFLHALTSHSCTVVIGTNGKVSEKFEGGL